MLNRQSQKSKRTNIAWIVLVTIAALSLMTNVAIVYMLSVSNGFMEAMLEGRAKLFAAAGEASTGGVVMFGDSLTHEGLWSEYFPKQPILNRGISGDTTEDLIARLPQIFALQPRSIFLMIGTNDLWGRIDPADARRNFKKILDELATRTPGANVHLQSIPPFGANAPFPPERQAVRQWNEFIQAEAAARKLVFIDVGGRMSDAEGRLRVDYSNDGVHLLGPAYREWRSAIAGHLD